MALPTAGFPLPRTLLELFAGAAGLGLGLHCAIPGLRTVGYVEREAYAASVLVARMADALLDQAPIWDDVGTFDGRPWCGVVDLLAGGFPCQDISVAGKGAGLAGARSGLWSEFARIISEVRPRYVFIENVAALRSRGLDSVLSNLAALGFDAEWTCYRASDAGAPHRRDRIFILANACSDLLRNESGRGSWADGAGPSLAGNPRQKLANPERAEWEPDQFAPIIHNASGREWREATNQSRGGRSSLFPPGPGDSDGWKRVLAQRPDLEPAVCRVADGLADRVDRLRVCGNGVVPIQAAEAFLILWDRMVNGADQPGR
jgi:DNA (cytosine-5)-methyltransferase 1